ncbi:hypothetical protein, partial [Streptomyces flavofungini]|uniref:hypothetical protein n=1 Tax=Streptomyces flavofungini TaxID=68200 RepID=UPI0034DFABE4
ASPAAASPAAAQDPVRSALPVPSAPSVEPPVMETSLYPGVFNGVAQLGQLGRVTEAADPFIGMLAPVSDLVPAKPVSGLAPRK